MNEDKCPNCHDWIRDCICEEDDDFCEQCLTDEN